MGLWLPFSYRNPLAYPAGVAPGFDPTHPLAKGMAGVLGFSAVSAGKNFVSLLTGTPGSVTGTFTAAINGYIGQCTNFPGSFLNQIAIPGVATQFLSGVFSATIFPTSFAAAGNIVGNTATGNVGAHLQVNTSGNILLNFTNIAQTASSFALVVNTPYWVAASYNGSTINYCAVNLSTGAIVTSTTSTGTVPATGGASYEIGYANFKADFVGFVSHAHFAPSFVSLTQLAACAADPWSFWYPPQRTRSYPYQIAAQGISFDAASNSGYQTAQSTYSWSHTCTGSSRYLTVGISMLSVAGSSVSSITYNGVAMSLIDAKASVSGAIRAELWGLVAPATGSNTIAVTLSAALDSAGGAVSFMGVHQTSPYEGAADATATNVGAADATVNVTTVADNDWCVDVVATNDTAITVGALQTSRSNVTGTLGSGAMSTEGPETPAGAFTMSWTNVDALKTWSIVSVALRPVQASALGAIYTQLERGIRGLFRGVFTGGYH